MARRQAGRPWVTGSARAGVEAPPRQVIGWRLWSWLSLVVIGLWMVPLGGSAFPSSWRPSPPAPLFPRGGAADAPVPYARGEARPRGNTPEGARFADWVVSTDPQQQYMLEAFVRDDRVLGVLVNPRLTNGQVQQMLTSLLSGMQRTFPDRPLEVIAYDRSGDQLARLTWDSQTRRAHTAWRR
jgi:hypothetical protein